MNREPVVAEMPDVEPVLVKAMIQQAMCKAYAVAADLDQSEAYNAMIATWESGMIEEPITMQGALDAVADDLSYWGEE